MMKQKNKIRFATALSLVFLLVGVATAHADLMLKITQVNADNTETLLAEVADNGAGDQLDQQLGTITFNQKLGNFIVNVVTGVSKGTIGSANQPFMDLHSINVSGANGGTLRIYLTDTDFTATGDISVAMDFGGTIYNGSTAYSTYFDNENNPYAGTLINTLGPFTGTNFSGGSSTGINVDGSFSLTQILTITLNSGGTLSSADAGLKVPEPASVSLLGFGLFAISLVLRRRKIHTF